jgi:hypothetical protein
MAQVARYCGGPSNFSSIRASTGRIIKTSSNGGHSLCRTINHDELLRRTGSAQVFTNTQSSCIFEAPQIVAAFDNVRFIFMKRVIEDNLLRSCPGEWCSSSEAVVMSGKAGLIKLSRRQAA